MKVALTTLVEQYESVWKVSKRNLTRLKKDVAEGKEYNLDNYGTYVGTISFRPLQAGKE
jgi:hypothetical protein